MRRSSGHGGGGRGGVGGGVVPAASLAALLCCLVALASGAAAQRPRLPPTYKTLSGDAPLIIAQGGFSGILPDSSQGAYAFGVLASAPDTSSWCSVQLTRDGVGICLRDINMQNCTTVSAVYPARQKTYVINGVQKTGWFPMDFNMSELQTVALTQAIYSRTPKFDAVQYPILSVTDLPAIIESSPLWLNVQHNIFYKQHGLSMRKYIHSIKKHVSMNYISSPELGFLQSIAGRVNRKTKLVFSFVNEISTDPSTNQTYDSLLRNLTFVKTIASGIMIPKSYIWPVTSDNYLLPHTSIVTEAHNAGLEVYAADFANDRVIPYNYSYDPLEEYLSFVNSTRFSVDGVLSDHPITASEAIGCFVNLTSTKVNHENPLVISHNGASGDFPDCTDLAYRNAINDGADVIDCPIQVTSDGVLKFSLRQESSHSISLGTTLTVVL
ncbi:hypothetical protein QOZ80_8AG0636350 [Eleusine coracana subsp. coracana]|nr:hypothetical protein QOZ80_8AG0636350 [Eleusine coracana subsp. coracana]